MRKNENIEIVKREGFDYFYLITEDDKGNKIAFEVDNEGK